MRKGRVGYPEGGRMELGGRMAVFGDGEGGAGRLGETPAREKKIAHFQMLFDHKSGRRQLHAGNIWDNGISLYSE